MAPMAIDESFNGARYSTADDVPEIEDVVVIGAGPAGLMLA
jgi:NADPH-dependent 2,4-dienoyl-CoA reductase/sulfur reductase-like enzyme